MSGEGVETVDDLDSGEPAAAVVDEAAKAADAPAGDDDPELNDISVEVQRGGQTVKMAPVSTIVAHRKAAREAKTNAEAATARANDLEAQLKKTNGDVEKLSPLLKALQGRPDLVDHAMRGTRPSSVEHPENVAADPEMVELAKDWELYDAEGKPDAARAARIFAKVGKQAESKAEAKVAPIINGQVQLRAEANKALLYGWAKDGHVTKDGVDKALAMLPGAEQLLAHDGVRDVLYFMAKGMSPAQAKAAAGATDLVIHTEAAGGRGKASVELPGFSKQIAARRGKSTAEWSKIREQDGDVLE